MTELLNDWQQFHFLRPMWLLAVIPLIALVLMLRFSFKHQSGWQKLLPGHLYRHLVSDKGQGKNRPPLLLLALGWIIATLALAGPTWQQLPQPVYQLKTGKVVIMDMSMSMRATDLKPDRLTRAKFKAIDLVEQISEGETGLVAYAGEAFVISPLTSDGQNLTTLIPSLSPEIMPEKGSEPIFAFDKAIELLQNAGYKQGEIFWITDGIDMSQIPELQNLLNKSPYRVSVLGVGSKEGSPIKLTNGEFMRDRNGAIVLPKMDASLLQGVARAGNGRFVTLYADDSDIDYLVDQPLLERNTAENEEQEDSTGDQWKEMGPYLLLLLLPLAAYSFRRGLLAVFVVGLLMPGFTPEAQADWWDDLWKTGNQQGQQAFKQKQFTKAAQQFNDPLWKGAAHYRAGNYAEALQAYQQSDSTEALYNQGNALAQLGEFEQAISIYDKVLAHDPEHEDAKANKALLEQQQQQKEQQQNQQNQQNSDQSESEDQQNQQNQQNQSDSEQNQQSQSQPQQSDEQSQEQQNAQSEQNQQQQDDQSAQDEQKEQKEQQAKQSEQQKDQQKPSEQQLSNEDKERMQRMQNLLRKVPDDPSYLLKRKMLLEHQRQRRRPRPPIERQRKW